MPNKTNDNPNAVSDEIAKKMHDTHNAIIKAQMIRLDGGSCNPRISIMADKGMVVLNHNGTWHITDDTGVR